MHYTFDAKVADFRQALDEQLLDAAEILMNAERPKRLAGLRLLILYYEALGKYGAGYCSTGDSRHHFVRGCRDVLARRGDSHINPSDRQLELFYKKVRCGLAHGATLPFAVGLTVSQYGLLIGDDGSLLVCPEQLLDDLRRDLYTYIEALSDPRQAALKSNFEARWDYETT